MSRDYTTVRRHRGKGDRIGRMEFARPVGDLVDGVGLLPAVACCVSIAGPLVVADRRVELRPLSSGSFAAWLVDGDGKDVELIATGGVVGVFTAIGRRLAARFAVFEG